MLSNIQKEAGNGDISQAYLDEFVLLPLCRTCIDKLRSLDRLPNFDNATDATATSYLK